MKAVIRAIDRAAPRFATIASTLPLDLSLHNVAKKERQHVLNLPHQLHRLKYVIEPPPVTRLPRVPHL